MAITYPIRPCEKCGIKFQPVKSWQRFCCPEHAMQTYNKTHDIAGMLRKIRKRRRKEREQLKATSA